MIAGLACKAPPPGSSTTSTSTSSESGASADTDSSSTSGSETQTEAETETEAESGETGEMPWEGSYPDQRVGIFYLAWHTYAAQVMAQIDPADRLVGEDVIASTSWSFHDMITAAGLSPAARSFHYHDEPTLGFYCLYRPRSGEDGPLPDCGEATGIAIADVAARHAEQLWDAGVDFVYVDLTNLPSQSEFTDVLGLRPFEVLLEEWAELRAGGSPTPQVAAWVPATITNDGAEPTFRALLDVYAEPAFAGLILEHEDQPVMFVVDHGGLPLDAAYVAEIAAAGVLPVPLWGNLSQAALDAGTAGWMQPCTSGGGFTTLIDPGTPCNQGYTTTSPLGTVVSVSRSYQIGYASLPYQSVGRRGGLTLALQMQTALAVQPDYLMFNAWNEWVAQPQPNPHPESLGNLRKSMGEGHVDDAAPGSTWLWVDMYGVEFNRDLEPSVGGGDSGYALLRSCIDVYKTGATACADASQACCQLDDPLTLIHSLRVPGGGSTDTDHVLSKDSNEIAMLTGGGAYQEVCNPIYGPPELCGGGTSADGPFHVYAAGGPERAPLWRCRSGVDHFFSTNANCEGTTVEHQLGWLSTQRTSETPRPFSRCYNPTDQVHFHWLDETCPGGVNDEGVLGYVR